MSHLTTTDRQPVQSVDGWTSRHGMTYRKKKQNPTDIEQSKNKKYIYTYKSFHRYVCYKCHNKHCLTDGIFICCWIFFLFCPMESRTKTLAAKFENNNNR